MNNKPVALTAEEKEIIHFSLSMRSNHVQTHDCSLSAVDAKNVGKPQIIQPLNSDQMRFLLKIEDIQRKMLC